MLAGETGWFVVLQIFKEDNEDAVTSAVLFSSDRQQPPNTATLQRRSDSCDIFWHRESPKTLWQSVSDVQDVFSLQNSAEEEVVRSLSSKTRLIIFFLGDCLFWADVRKKLVCVRQSSAKCQTEQQNKQRCGKNTATLLTRSDKYQPADFFLQSGGEDKNLHWVFKLDHPPENKHEDDLLVFCSFNYTWECLRHL